MTVEQIRQDPKTKDYWLRLFFNQLKEYEFAGLEYDDYLKVFNTTEQQIFAAFELQGYWQGFKHRHYWNDESDIFVIGTIK